MARVRSAGWWLAVALGVSVLAGAWPAADGARPPGGTRQAGLRVVRIFGPAGDATGILDISAVGDRDAVAVGYTCGAACNRTGGVASGFLASRLLVERWNGVAWRALPGPAGLAGYPEGISVSGTSADDLWIAAMGQEGSVASEVDLPYVLHWSHGHWAVFRFARGAWLNQVVAFSDSDVWVFAAVYANAEDRPDISYALHYDGHAWRKFALPVLPGQTGVTSASDMWVVGPVAGKPLSQESGSLAVHWDGHAWRTMRVPAITPPPGRSVDVGGTVLMAGPDNVWTSYEFRGANSSYQVGGLLHWVHGRWHRVSLPRYGKITTPTAWMDQDGHGGLWLVTPGWLAHYSNGSWTRADVPTVPGHVIRLSFVTWITGTRSAWVGAWITPRNNPAGSTQFALLELAATGM